MASKAILSCLFIMFSSYLHVGFSDNISGNLDQLFPGLGIGQAVAIQDAQCMQKLYPCQSFLKSPDSPSESCCEPLKQMHDNKSECLCNFMNNVELLQSINVRKEQVYKLPEACGLEVDPTKCENTENATSEESSGSSVTLEEEESTSSTKMITPNGIIYFGVPAFVALLTALVFSA